MNWWEQWKWFRLQGKAWWEYPYDRGSGYRFLDKRETRLFIKGLEYPIHTLKLRRNWIEKL